MSVLREVPEQDADLETIGHVCGEQRAADLALLPMRTRKGRSPRARLTGLCTRCKVSPISTAPRPGNKPRRFCDHCAKQWTAARRW